MYVKQCMIEEFGGGGGQSSCVGIVEMALTMCVLCSCVYFECVYVCFYLRPVAILDILDT